MTPEELRADIPVAAEATYLNTGASGPSPHRVVESVESFLEYHEYEAPLDEGMYEAAFDVFDGVRGTVADLLGADPEEVALTESTTDGINRLACAMEWAPGDVVVRTDLEHPAGTLPWQRLQRTHGVDVRVVESEAGRLDLDAYREAVADAKLVCFSSLTWTHGTRLPVEQLVEIAHDAGALVLVDAVQMPGQTAVDVHEWGADVVAGAGHKWLLGPWGAGYLYVSREVAETLEPRTIGYRSVETPTADTYEFKAGAPRFEIGSANPAPYVGLETAIETIRAVGLDVVESRIHRLAARLVDGVPDDRLLSPSPPESGLVTIDVDDPEATVERLKADGVIVRTLPDPAAVRASVHAFNTEADVDALLAGLQREW